MTREVLQQEVRELMETITEQVKATEEFKGRMPLIEADILMANIRKLYEYIYKLQHLEEESAPKSRKMPIKPATIDLFAEEEPVYNMTLDTPSPSSHPSPSSPTSPQLKSLIGINDKFLFINELFDGNLKEYNEAIETLSGFKDSRAAMEFLNLLREKNMWETSSRAFVKLKGMIG
jgi:hypothetical protein